MKSKFFGNSTLSYLIVLKFYRKKSTMLVTFLVFASVIIVFLLACIVYIYPGKKNVTTVPGMDASDEKLGNFPDIQVCIFVQCIFVYRVL